MKPQVIIAVVAALLVTAVGGEGEGKLLRRAAQAPFSLSSCLRHKSEGDCNASKDRDTNEACVWCKCSAIPSECLSVSESALLPSSVFDCATPKSTVRSFEFQPGLTHTLTKEGVDPNFCDPNSKSFSGYMDITGSKYDGQGEDKHLFYWFFEKRTSSLLSPLTAHDEEEAVPLILWLTGGPGCSSTLALLTENGPCKVHGDGKDGTTDLNPYSWTEAAHVLWLDQPAGVGYSYGAESDKNEEMVGEDAYYFLQAFYKDHPELLDNPLYVVGESYGGHYAPSIAHKIFTENANIKEGMEKVNLQGVGIGNGLTKPSEQYKWYPEMAFKNSHGIKVVDEKTYEYMKSVVPKCVALIDQCNKGENFLDTFACQTAFVLCNAGETSPYQLTGLNPYDIRKKCGPHPLCYDFSNIERFLNLDSTKAALHVSEKSNHWQSCNMGINLKFRTDWMKDFSPFVKDLLNGGIPVLVYAGDADFICNYLGNRAWTLGLDWDHASDFVGANEHEWGTADGDKGAAAGLVRSANGLTFLQIYDAGHMVPSDQPAVALDMISNFVSGGTF